MTAKTAKHEKTLSQAIRERRATPSFDGTPIPAEDLQRILEAGLSAPSGYNMQPWRFIVVQSDEQKKRLRAASYNQGKVEEASAVIVACGDADGWRKDLDLMLYQGREGGMPEGYADQARNSVPNYLSHFSTDEMHGWLNKMVMIAFTHMMLMAEVHGLRHRAHGGLRAGEGARGAAPARSATGWSRCSPSATSRGRTSSTAAASTSRHTVFAEEFGKPLK